MFSLVRMILFVPWIMPFNWWRDVWYAGRCSTVSSPKTDDDKGDWLIEPTVGNVWAREASNLVCLISWSGFHFPLTMLSLACSCKRRLDAFRKSLEVFSTATSLYLDALSDKGIGNITGGRNSPSSFGAWKPSLWASLSLLAKEKGKQLSVISMTRNSVKLCYVNVKAMLCYAMLCYAMLCYAMLCYAMLCYAMLCYAMLCYVTFTPVDVRKQVYIIKV